MLDLMDFMTRHAKFTASAACLIAASCVLVTGCAREPSPSPGPVEIRYWTGWSGYELRAQKEIIAEFERTHPHIKVRITSVATSYDKVRLAFASGAPPDVMSCVWAEEIPIYAMRDLLEPLGPLLKKSGRSIEEWVPVTARMGSYGGETYALAATVNVNLIAYNKSVARESGLDPNSPPQSTEELERWHEAMTVLEEGKYRRVGFVPQMLELWAYAFGGRWYDADTGRITATHPGNLAALRWMAGWARTSNAIAMQRFEQTFGNMISANGPFVTGKVGMLGTGDWFRGLMKQFGEKVDWGYVGYNGPAEGGRRNVAAMNGSVFVIPADAQHKAEAWEFLNWFCGPEGSYRFCTAISNLPALKELQQKPPYSTDPFLRFCSDVSRGEGAMAPPPIPIWPQYKAEITRVEDHVVRGGADPEKMLRQLQERMERELERAMEAVPAEEVR